MGAWHSAYANLLRSRFSALVAYAELLVDSREAARDLAQESTVAVFSRRKAPRDTRSAEIACREWMAARAAADPSGARPAAAVLIAIDGKDADGVRAVLGKATPDPLPDPSPEDIAALRARFTGSAATYAVPSGGVNTVMAPARGRHRSALAGAAAGTTAAVAAVAVAGWFGLDHLPSFGGGAAAPTASGSPSPTTLAVTWNPQPAVNEAMEGFALPKCGDAYEPSTHAVGGITPKPTAELQEDDQYGDYVMLSDGFVSEDQKPAFVLAGGGYYVITLDGKVVWVSDSSYHGVDVYTANNPVPGASGPSSGLQRSNLCDAVEPYKKFEKKWEGIDWNDPDDQLAYQEALKKFLKKLGDFPKGTYKIYQVNPIVFGEQEALAEVFAAEGINQINNLEYDITYTNLAQDPRVSPYCSGDYNVGDFQCNPPLDVLHDVLTRDIDPADINDVKGAVAISEPLEYTME
ncbi:MAG: hypothetical protein NVV57_04080 [Demequina sp.]|nr:hypothetical protein [Demequina sp.]